MTKPLRLATTGGGSGPPVYIEDVFSTYLYTGNGSTQTINNGIDLAGKGGLVWSKSRTTLDAEFKDNSLVDSARGVSNTLVSNDSGSQLNSSFYSSNISAFNSNGYSLTGYTSGTSSGAYNGTWINRNTLTYVSWTFRKQPKFFDVVTFTTNSLGGFSFSHSLGSTPGAVFVKSTAESGNWIVYHRSIPTTDYLKLNQTSAKAALGATWTATSTTFSLSDGGLPPNVAHVAYLFAHDAGGFGPTGTDNVITCGSYTGNGSSSGPTVTLGYEPQWLLVKRSSAAGNNWMLVDNMRGFTADGTVAQLYPNTSGAEESFGGQVAPTATGFQVTSTGTNFNASGSTYIYIAIRRGPMKTPTTGTSVFTPVLFVGDGSTNKPPVNAGFNAPDLAMSAARVDPYGIGPQTRDRLSSSGQWYLNTASTGAQANYSGNTDGFRFLQKGIDAANAQSTFNQTSPGTIYWMFGRAPGFFDVVCYTGTGGLGTVAHNLGAVPELMIVKSRSHATDWIVYHKTTGNNRILKLNSDGTGFNTDYWQDTNPTATSIFLNGVPDVEVFGSGRTYVAYLFASCPGVSHVGSYTGNGSSQTINCGFSNGARFVLVKRTDAAGDWYVWDTARGIVAANDPRLSLNSTSTETSDDSIDPVASGFVVNQVAATNINVSNGTYIYLAIA